MIHGSRTTGRNIAGWFWLFGFVALPLLNDALRFESYESPRAMFSVVIGMGIGLISLLSFLNLPHPLTPSPLRREGEPGDLDSPLHAMERGGGVRQKLILSASPQAERGNWLTSSLRSPLILAVIAWGISITLSEILSLSPSRSMWGDLYRRMGLLTQISLIAALIGGALITQRIRGRVWPLLAISGSIIASIGIAQRFGLSILPQLSNWRPASTLGTSIFAGSWCVIVILWLVVALMASNQHKRRVYLYRFSFSLVVLIIFFILTESRGAALGLAAGLAALAITWAVAQGRWQLIRRVLIGGGLLALGGFAIVGGMINLHGTVFANLPLIGRLNAITDDQTTSFRLALWRDAGQIIADWPATVATMGQPDRSNMRLLHGYGQEMFQFVEQHYTDEALAATHPPYEFIDRAHNVLLDTWITQGYLGLISLLTIYGAAVWTCYKVLRQQGSAWDERGWIAAGAQAIVVGHFVDLQFSFQSVASEWPFWASLGLLFGIAREPIRVRQWPNARIDARFIPVIIWVLVWSIGAALIRPIKTIDMAVLLAYHTLLVIGLGVIGFRYWHIQLPYRVLLILIMLIPTVWWVLDSAADSLARLARDRGGVVGAQLYNSALALKTPDDRLLLLAGGNALTLAYEQPAQWLDRADHLLSQAVRLNPYNVDLTILRASYQTLRALTFTDPLEREAQLDQADGLYQTAVDQSPGRAALWLDWARFALTVRRQPERAITLAQEAQSRLPTIPTADRLIGDAYHALWTDTAESAFAARAEAAYRAALARDKRDTAASLSLADLYYAQQQYGSAKAVLMQALRHATRIIPRIQVTLALARTLEAQHNPALALRFIRQIDNLPMDWLKRIEVTRARDRLLQQVTGQP
ncbi:MAG: O-antigen ligase family protein [Anaerolineae bacterium]|nr:O-antigen ligase family protein [Anaerolineae bacterium]